VNPREIVALVRRHAVAVGIVLLLAAGFGYRIKHEDPGYAANATVAFVGPNNGVVYGSSLLVIDAVVTDMVMGPRGQQQVRLAGGTAPFDVALVNLNNEEFPYYAVPYVNVTAASSSAAAAGQTFSAVMKVLQEDLATLQIQQGVKPRSLIRLRAIAPSAGPVSLKGSRIRTFGGVALLAIIASLIIAKFLDRHPFRPGNMLRKRNEVGYPARNRPTFRAGREAG
jgi:hypothetical protein